jgi:hypothetical protein
MLMIKATIIVFYDKNNHYRITLLVTYIMSAQLLSRLLL